MSEKVKLKKRTKENIDDVVNSAIKKSETNIKKEIVDVIPTGSTLVDLCCTDDIQGGFGLGKFTNLIGDSDSGKTIFALTSMAAIANNPKFDKYDIYYDDAEAALEFDIEYMFGKIAQKRIRMDYISETVQDLFGNIMKLIKKGDPFIYVQDSLDSITSVEEQERANEEYIKGKKKGSYKTEKPRLMSEFFRVVRKDLRDLKSSVIIISQTRENIGIDAMFKPKTRAGGKALKFYSTHEVWLASGAKHKENERIIGTVSQVKVTKNKLTGKKRDCNLDIFYDYGIDDIGSQIDFLVKEGYWKKKSDENDKRKKVIIADGLNISESREELIKTIERDDLEGELKKITKECWINIENNIKLNRKKRFE